MSHVSVIIPAYNSGPYLDEAVRSVIAQTFTEWECVVVDDGSTEDLSRVEKMDSRVRLIRQENRGISMARNRGIAESTGEFIAFLDHDDMFLPTKLQKQVEAAASDSRIGLIHSDFDVINANGDRRPGPKPVNPATDFLSMLGRGAPLPTCTMVSREAIRAVGIFDPFLTPSEDHDLFIRIARYFRVVHIPSPQALYRAHGSNTSKNYMVCYRTVRNLAQRHKINAEFRGDAAAAGAAGELLPHYKRNIFGPQAYDAARLALARREPAAFLAHIVRATVWSPGYTIGSIAKFPLRRTGRRR